MAAHKQRQASVFIPCPIFVYFISQSCRLLFQTIIFPTKNNPRNHNISIEYAQTAFFKSPRPSIVGRSPSICEFRMVHVVCWSTIIRFVNSDGGMVSRNKPGRNGLHQMLLLRNKNHILQYSSIMTLFKALNFS